MKHARSTSTWWRSAAVATVALTAMLSGCAAEQDTPSVRTTPSQSPSQIPEISTGDPIAVSKVPPATVDEVKETASDYFASVGQLLKDPKQDPQKEPSGDDKPTAIPGLAGAALEELLNTKAEFTENGWRAVGTAKVVSQRLVKATKNPQGVIIRACVDNSGVKIVDRNGDEVPNSRPPKARSLNFMTLIELDGDWAVTEMRLATNPNC